MAEEHPEGHDPRPKLVSPAADPAGLPLAWPTEYRTVTQPFGARPEYYGQWGLAGHEGLDLRAPARSQIFAAAAGLVSLVASGGNYGNQVRLKHLVGGKKIMTVYAHLEKALVRQGDTVTRGQVIGLADTTGNAQGTHLHFGLKVEGEAPTGYGGYSDPAPWLSLR